MTITPQPHKDEASPVLLEAVILNFDSFSSQSSRETKAASHVLQTVWSYKELRNALTKDGWNKSHFQVGRSEALRYMGRGVGVVGGTGEALIIRATLIPLHAAPPTL